MKSISISALFSFLLVLSACSSNTSNTNKNNVGSKTIDTISGFSEKNSKDSINIKGQEHKDTVVRAVNKTAAASNENLKHQSNIMNNLPKPPHFSNEDVNKGIQDFDRLVRENIVAEQDNDSAKMQMLKEQTQSIALKMTLWIFKMSKEERASFKDYMENVSKVTTKVDQKLKTEHQVDSI